MRAAVTEAETAVATDSCGEQDLVGAVLAKLCNEVRHQLRCAVEFQQVHRAPGQRQLCNRW